jgi:hypothetical protein
MPAIIIAGFIPVFPTGHGFRELNKVALVSCWAWACSPPGQILMLAWRGMSPQFFRGEVLKHDTPSLVIVT